MVALIAPGYTNMKEQLTEHFAAEGVISLQEFLTPESLKELQAQLSRCEFVESNYLMSHRYFVSHMPSDSKVVLEEVETFIQDITNTSGKLAFKPYYLTHKSNKLREVQENKYIAVVLDVSVDFPEGNGGDVGYETESDNLLVPPTTNTLTLVKVTAETEHFITYCNHYTQGKKRLLLMGKIE